MSKKLWLRMCQQAHDWHVHGFWIRKGRVLEIEADRLFAAFAQRRGW